jgi:hypothetical protein
VDICTAREELFTNIYIDPLPTYKTRLKASPLTGNLIGKMKLLHLTEV